MAVRIGAVTGNFCYCYGVTPQLQCECRVFVYVICVIASHRFSTARLVQSLIMVQAVEEVNKMQKLGNLTLGYRILDSCADVTTALMNTLSFMKKHGE